MQVGFVCGLLRLKDLKIACNPLASTQCKMISCLLSCTHVLRSEIFVGTYLAHSVNSSMFLAINSVLNHGVLSMSISSSMLQFAVGFVITPRLRHYTKLPWREIKTKDTLARTKNGLQALKKSKTTQKGKRQVHKSDPNELRWEHPQVKAQAEGGWAGKTTRAKARHKKNA